MASETILKDIGEIYSRILDQKPALQGQINFMLREFEEKREDRELSRLTSVYENIHSIAEDALPTSCRIMHDTLPLLSDTLKEANEKCQSILENEGKSEKSEWLIGERSQRAEQWRTFIDNMCVKSEAVDQEYDHEVTALKRYHRELEEKLKL